MLRACKNNPDHLPAQRRKRDQIAAEKEAVIARVKHLTDEKRPMPSAAEIKKAVALEGFPSVKVTEVQSILKKECRRSYRMPKAGAKLLNSDFSMVLRQ